MFREETETVAVMEDEIGMMSSWKHENLTRFRDLLVKQFWPRYKAE